MASGIQPPSWRPEPLTPFKRCIPASQAQEHLEKHAPSPIPHTQHELQLSQLQKAGSHTPSFSLVPVAWVFFCRSDPARSTKFNCRAGSNTYSALPAKCDLSQRSIKSVTKIITVITVTTERVTTRRKKRKKKQTQRLNRSSSRNHERKS